MKERERRRLPLSFKNASQIFVRLYFVSLSVIQFLERIYFNQIGRLKFKFNIHSFDSVVQASKFRPMHRVAQVSTMASVSRAGTVLLFTCTWDEWWRLTSLGQLYLQWQNFGISKRNYSPAPKVPLAVLEGLEKLKGKQEQTLIDKISPGNFLKKFY